MADKPAKKFRLGLVTSTIWRNETDNGSPFYTVNLQRSYKNKDGEWQAGDNLNHDDLLNAAKVLCRAEAWIADQ